MTNPERPIRKDEIVLEERGIYVESWLPERRSRRRPLLFVHGELGGSWVWEPFLGYFAHRGWEGHAVNLSGHFWSEASEILTVGLDTYVDDVVAVFERIPPHPVLIGHGTGGLVAMLAAEERHVAGLVLVSPAPPEQLRTPPRPHVIREIPETYDRALVDHGVGRGSRLLEVAAGTAQIGLGLAHARWRVTALDVSAAMVAFASTRGRRGGVHLATLAADMRSFAGDQELDAAINPMSSFRLLLSDAAVDDHLRCLADARSRRGA